MNLDIIESQYYFNAMPIKSILKVLKSGAHHHKYPPELIWGILRGYIEEKVSKALDGN